MFWNVIITNFLTVSLMCGANDNARGVDNIVQDQQSLSHSHLSSLIRLTFVHSADVKNGL
jgi:hypothetical protein